MIYINAMQTTPPVSASAPRVDTNLGRFSQACTVVLTALAFLLNQPVIVLIVAVVMTLSSLVPAFGPYRLLYWGVVVPLGPLKPRVVEDDPAPHRFAQGVGAVFLMSLPSCSSSHALQCSVGRLT